MKGKRRLHDRSESPSRYKSPANDDEAKFMGNRSVSKALPAPVGRPSALSAQPRRAVGNAWDGGNPIKHSKAVPPTSRGSPQWPALPLKDSSISGNATRLAAPKWPIIPPKNSLIPGNPLSCSQSTSSAAVTAQADASNQSALHPYSVTTQGIGNKEARTMYIQSGSHSSTHVGDDNGDNKGIIGHGAINLLVQGGSVQIDMNHKIKDQPTTLPIGCNPMTKAVIYIKATLAVLHALFGYRIVGSALRPNKFGLGKTAIVEYCRLLIDAINSVTGRQSPNALQLLKDRLVYLGSILNELYGRFNSDPVNIKTLSNDITLELALFLFSSHLTEQIPPEIMTEKVKKKMIAEQEQPRETILRQSVKDLPNAKAGYNDYVSASRRRVTCFKGTRKELLRDAGEWVAKSDGEIYGLFGLAGIGKSTIAQTIAEKADQSHLLGASFFFSREEPDRRTAKKFFTTIAFQLCVNHAEFAVAIESVLVTERGKDATAKHPLQQLDVLILEPLRKLSLRARRVVIVVDALDECDDEDGPIVIEGLRKLSQALPTFRIFLTTRPQEHLQFLLRDQELLRVFHLHNIDNNVVDGDIRRYLAHNLSLETVRDRLQDPKEQWSADDGQIDSLVKVAGRLFIIASTSILFILDKATRDPECRLKKLLDAVALDRTPFETALSDFYTVILRSAIPKGCDPHAVKRYQIVIGSIILIRAPLAIKSLANLIDYKPKDINKVLAKLQPVILIDDSSRVPRVYHKSFSDHIQDPVRCEADLHIKPTFHHTRMAIHCFRKMNQLLKQNILDLSDSRQFMCNDKALESQGITVQLQAKIPLELRYACLYFANHIERADVSDPKFSTELEIFANKRIRKKRDPKLITINDK